MVGSSRRSRWLPFAHFASDWRDGQPSRDSSRTRTGAGATMRQPISLTRPEPMARGHPMTTQQFPTLHVAVALILDADKQKILFPWNEHWRTFALPMSKPGRGNPAREPSPAALREAAERAAAEA